MINFRDVDNIKEQHDFRREIMSIPAVKWVGERDIGNYDIILNETVEKIETIDGNLELIISEKEDEGIKYALARAYHSQEPITIQDLVFRPVLPCGRVQTQRKIIENLSEIADGKEPETETLDQELGLDRIRAIWEVNPTIGTLAIDYEERKVNLRDALKIFLGYLEPSEHNFLKQALSDKLNILLHDYDMLLLDSERWGEKFERKLITHGDFLLNHYRLGNIRDHIYYRRAMDFMSEIKKIYNFLDGNEFSNDYLLRIDDLKPEKQI